MARNYDSPKSNKGLVVGGEISNSRTCHLDPKCFGENIYIEVPTNITERVQLTFKVTFIYRKFINLYTNKFILHK